MSLVEKLSISGIRSFGSERNEKQNIQFSSPVTLILGANGCGKTTVIECLKFALTGEMPPGTNKGKSFVHDPKISKSIESLGQVKLQVRNIRGQHVTITRSVKTFMQNKELKFKNMNVALHVVDVNGKESTTTNRCLDGTTEMCNAMGVSKAIINNVIFCHQEDSNWPLDEPKKLKEKFDAIFGTTEYNRAIDRIIKIRKDWMEKLRNKESDLKLAQHMKTEAESKQLNARTAEEKHEKLMEDKNQLEKELEPILVQLTEIEEKEKKLSRIHQQRIIFEAKLDSCQQQQGILKKKIKRLFSGSSDLLEIEISSFKSDILMRRESLTGLNIELNRLKATEKRIASKLTELEKQRTKLSFQRQQEQELLAERGDKLKELCGSLGVAASRESVEFETNSESIVDILSEIQLKLRNDEKDVQEMSKTHDEMDKILQKAIDEKRENKASVENEIGSKIRQIETMNREKSDLGKEIVSVERSAQELKRLDENIKKYDVELEGFKKNVNLDEMKLKINGKKDNCDLLQEKLDKIDNHVTYLNKIAKISVEIATKEKDLNSRELEVKRIKVKHMENFRLLFPGEQTIESNYKREVTNALIASEKTRKETNASLNSRECDRTKQSTIRLTIQANVKRMRKELADGEEKIYDQCGSSSFTEHLEKVKHRVEKTQNDFGAFQSSDVLYKRYINLMEAEPRCPLCRNGMSLNEVGTLTTELKDELHMMPDKIERTKLELKDLKDKYDTLLTLQPLIHNIERLKVDIPKEEESLRECKQKLADSESAIELLKGSVVELERKQQQLNSMVGDMSLLDEALKDVERISCEIAKLKADLPTVGDSSNSSMNLDDAQLEKTTIAGELKFERQELNRLEKSYERGSEKIFKLRELRSQLKEKEIKLKEGVQNLGQLKARIDDISKQIIDLQVNRSDLERKLPPLVRDMDEAVRSQTLARQKNREILSAAQIHLTDNRNGLVAVEKLGRQLCELEALNIAEEIETVKGEIKKYTDDEKVNTTAAVDMTKKIEGIRDDISTHELTERDLLDNRDLKKLEFEEQNIQENLDKINSNIGEANAKTISRDKNELCKKRDNIFSKRSNLSGQMGELQNQIDQMHKELNKNEYKNSLKNYRNATYEVETAKAILHDIKEYRAALEWALIKFHSEKMEKINMLIREYWRSIYRGNDIDYVEIKTEESSSGTDNRRSYNYRVVQSKNLVELDMRGRCSAGQRVLACLIIRIALAETFSANCGVLALDEPTTNLDRANIISLCEVLTRVIDERRNQLNFLMIIITHDEEFVSTIGNIDAFYKLSRSNDGKSIIEKVTSH